MHYRLNLIVPSDLLTIQKGRFAVWSPASDVQLESRKWLKSSDNSTWTSLGTSGLFNDQGDDASFPGAPGIDPCVAADDVSVYVGVPQSLLHPGNYPSATVTAVFARNQLGQSNTASPFRKPLAPVNGSPLRCMFTASPDYQTDNAHGMYWFVLKFTENSITVGNLIGRYEFNVSANVTINGGASELGHDPEMDVGS